MPVLTDYARNLTLLSAEGKLPNCYARESEIEAIQISMRRHTKPNILLTGDTGCGKTAIVEGLAQKLEEQLYTLWEQKNDESLSVLTLLRPELPIIYELSAGDILAGARYRGDFEERMQNIIHELKNLNRKVLLFIDEAHLLTTLGDADGAVAAANLLKPALARGEFSVIAATTTDEYDRYLSKDKAFLRRFTLLEIKPIADRYRSDCAANIVNDYSAIFNIPCADNIDKYFLNSIVTGAMADKTFPCEFIDVVDRMFAEAAYKSLEQITKNEFQQAVRSVTGCLVM